jgi:hypothetical protein
MKTLVTIIDEKKSEEINWNNPQLVIHNNTIIQTSGDHDGGDFEGMVITSPTYTAFSCSKIWDKSVFKPFMGTVTLKNHSSN